MTAREAARVDEAKTQCMACLVWARRGSMPMEDVANECDYNHAKSGNIRRGHMYGYGGCGWHHRGIVGQGWTRERMRQHFGPSLMDGSRLFQDTYGTHDELIALQNEELGVFDAQ